MPHEVHVEAHVGVHVVDHVDRVEPHAEDHVVGRAGARVGVRSPWVLLAVGLQVPFCSRDAACEVGAAGSLLCSKEAISISLSQSKII